MDTRINENAAFERVEVRIRCRGAKLVQKKADTIATKLGTICYNYQYLSGLQLPQKDTTW